MIKLDVRNIPTESTRDLFAVANFFVFSVFFLVASTVAFSFFGNPLNKDDDDDDDGQ